MSEKINEEEAADEATCVFNISVGYDECVDATVLQEDALAVAPVEAEAESSVSPTARFTFRDPSLGPSSGGRGRRSSTGQHARQGRGLPRKSPPA